MFRFKSKKTKTNAGSSTSHPLHSDEVKNVRQPHSGSAHHVAVSSGLRLNAGLARNRSVTEERDTEIQRSGSGGMLMRQSKKSREDFSKVRAAELSALYELSDDKDTTLNKKGIFKADMRHAPSLSGHVARSFRSISQFETKGSEELGAKKSKEAKHQVAPPSEKSETEPQARRNRKAGKSSRGINTSAYLQTSRLGTADQELSEEVGFEVVRSEGNHAEKNGFLASNGRVYHVSSLC